MPGSDNPISLIVVSRVRLYREGLASVLAGRSLLAVRGEASGLEPALDLVASTSPDIVVLDVSSPDGLEVAQAISEEQPETKIVAFAIDESEASILACVRAGIVAWVTRDASLDELVGTIESARRGELRCSARLAAAMFRRLAGTARAPAAHPDEPPLTGREQEVVLLIERGLSNKAIARSLAIEVATVKNHVHNILGKLGVATRAQAIARRRSRRDPDPWIHLPGSEPDRHLDPD